MGKLFYVFLLPDVTLKVVENISSASDLHLRISQIIFALYKIQVSLSCCSKTYCKYKETKIRYNNILYTYATQSVDLKEEVTKISSMIIC